MKRKHFGLKKESIQLEVIKNPYPQSINIQHHNIDLTITLEYIK
jgi:hypothetical protein